MAINMDEFASAWFSNGSAPPAPPPVQMPAQQAPPPVAQAQMPQQLVAQPQAQWRRCPDGSSINSDYTLDWGGEIGQPHSPVRLRHAASGQIGFEGTYRDLLAGQIPGVWLPGAAIIDDEQPQGATAYGDQFSGMGAPVDKYRTVKKVAGGLLIFGSLGAAIWSGWGLVSKAKAPAEED